MSQTRIMGFFIPLFILSLHLDSMHIYEMYMCVYVIHVINNAYTHMTKNRLFFQMLPCGKTEKKILRKIAQEK